MNGATGIGGTEQHLSVWRERIPFECQENMLLGSFWRKRAPEEEWIIQYTTCTVIGKERNKGKEIVG